MYIFIFLTEIVDSCSQNTNMTCGKPTWSAAAGYYTTGSALLILPMVHWACGLLPWLSPPQETEVLIITYKRYSCFHRKTLRPSLVLSLFTILSFLYSSSFITMVTAFCDLREANISFFCFPSTQELNLQQIQSKISTPHTIIFGVSEEILAV